MNIIRWNVRGLGRPAKRYLVKDFLEIHHVDVCCIQESKLAEINQLIWRSICDTRLDQFGLVPSIGTSGGVIIGWNSRLYKGKVIFVGTYCLFVEFTNLFDNSMWVCTSVYGPNLRQLKFYFWDEIRKCQTHFP